MALATARKRAAAALRSRATPGRLAEVEHHHRHGDGLLAAESIAATASNLAARQPDRYADAGLWWMSDPEAAAAAAAAAPACTPGEDLRPVLPAEPEPQGPPAAPARQPEPPARPRHVATLTAAPAAPPAGARAAA